MCTITCICGHSGDFETFIVSSLGLDLPRGHYQCPQCRIAWKVTAAPGQSYYGGQLYIPGDTKIETVPSEL